MTYRLWYLLVTSMTCIYNAKQTILNLQPNLVSSNDSNTENCTCIPYYQCKNNTFNIGGEGIFDIRRNDGPCKNYLLTCCKTEDRSPIVQVSLIKPPRGCGFRRPNGVGFQITGDKENESQFGEFPWMVAVLGDGHYQCGGSLIHPGVVLTAAHCVKNREKTFSIRAGEWDTRHVIEPYPHQERDVHSVEIHPDYYSGGLFNDVAFLVLREPVNITENVDVVCLSAGNVSVRSDDGRRCFANGWGEDAFDVGGNRAAILKKIDLPVVDREECQEKLRSTRLGADFKLHESFLCAGGEPGKDACTGDGGGPLACPVEGRSDRYFQAGIVSWGVGCGGAVPGLYADVAMFRDWIDDRMRANNFDVSGYQL